VEGDTGRRNSCESNFLLCSRRSWRDELGEAKCDLVRLADCR